MQSLTAFLLLLLAATVVAWAGVVLHKLGIRLVHKLLSLARSMSLLGWCMSIVMLGVSVMRGGEKLRGSNLPVGDGWENMPPITSTNTTRTLDADDFRRGFVLVGLSTNSPFSIFHSPFSNAVVCADWKAFGAAEDWTYANAEWRIENGELWGGVLSNETTRLRIHSDGWAEVLETARSASAPYQGGDGGESVPDDGRAGAPRTPTFFPFQAPLGIVPESNWQQILHFTPYTLHSRFWHGVTPSNTLQLTWQDALYGRDTNMPVGVQMEMRQDGRFTYRYDLRNVGCRMENGELDAAALTNIVIGASIGRLPFQTTLADLVTNTSFSILHSPFSIHFHPLSPEDAIDQDRDGDGLSLLDELFAFGTDPDLPDTDRDGLTDSEELVAGTDPLDPHSIRPDVCDGYALAMGGLDPLAVPEGSTNTVLEHLFYSGSTNGTIVLPQPSETHAVLSVSVSGHGAGELAVGDRVVPLFGPEPVRSDPEPPSYVLSFPVQRGMDVPVFLRADGTLSVALDSSEFAFGTLPSIGGGTFTGFVNFPNTVATTPCIHDFNARGVAVHLPVGEGASLLQCAWTGTAGVGVANSPPRSATISGDFPPRQTRSICYGLSHPQYLFGQTNYQQTVRFCPQLPEPGAGGDDPPWYVEGEGDSSYGADDGTKQEWHLCGCGSCDEGCVCGCRPPETGSGGGEPGGEEEDVCPEHEVPYSQCAHLHEAAYTNAVENLSALNDVLYIRDPPSWHDIHLEVPQGQHRCCPCPEHWENYVETSYRSYRLRLTDADGLPFKRSGASCTVRVAGAVPSAVPGDAQLAFSRNGEDYLSYRYTVLGVAIRNATGPSLDRYGTENPSFGFPVAVGAKAETPQLELVTKVGLGTGDVHVGFENATGGFVLWRGDMGGGCRKMLDTADGTLSREMSMQGWRQLIAKAGLHGSAYLPVCVTSTSAGHVDLVLRYWAEIDGCFVEDEVRQRITSVDPPMMADIDRDGAIGAGDVAAFVDGDTFRFWTNEDTDKGDYVGQVADTTPNAADLVVNGRLDLVNLFPVKLDLAPLIAAWPSAAFRLRAGQNRLRFCGVDVSPSAAGSIQTNSVVATGGGSQPAPLLSAAPLTAVTEGGLYIDPATYLGVGNAPGVLAFEAANEVWEDNSPELLVDVNGATLFRFKLPLAIDIVDHMYRWKGLRGVCGGSSAITDWTREPPNLPDDLMDCGDLFFVHGFNVSEADARNWSRQVFKRLWHSGSRARFHGIAWYGDYNLAGSAFNGFHYHQDVYHALKTASAFKTYVEGAQPQSAKRVLMAHSLGNMVVSEALRQGLAVGKYFMLNAAVASEALDGSFQNADAAIASKYVPSDWNGYTNLCWSANWHKWFRDDSTDSRGKMGWPDYFSTALNNAGTVYNYYSSGDLVFMETETPPGLTAGLFHWPTLSLTWPLISLNITEEAYSWQKQETHKGVDPLAGTLHGGWGFHCWEETVEGEPEFVIHLAAEANAMVEDGSVTNDPVFSIAGTQLNNRNATQDDIWLSLAKHVPAVSSPVGKMTIFDGTDFDLNDGNVIGLPNGWGRSGNVYGQSWLHSDMKDMAYFYVFSLYTEFVTKGMLR